MSKESESRRTESGRCELAAQYLVGCGGGHSVVRKQLGVEFPGVEPTVVGRMGDVKLPPCALVRNWVLSTIQGYGQAMRVPRSPVLTVVLACGQSRPTAPF
jgi:2-polyprenyl-6-methoxyphenol hydroxylase-like FAD-dependent oxidoreductase